MLTQEQLAAQRRDPSIAARIRRKSAERATGCWEWTGAVAGNGYASMRVAGKAMTAARVSFVAFNGPIPDGLFVLHRCDNPLCVNPAHLFLGTHADNMRDKREKGRATTARGERNHKAKLTTEAVRAIRASAEGPRALARVYSVDRNTITRVRKGRYWRDVC